MTDTGVVVILTALDLEYEAVRSHLVDVTNHRHRTGTRFEVGTIERTKCRVAIGLTGPGNNSSAVLAERSIQEFSPEVVMFVGVAGSLKESLALGDVVVPSHVYAYHGGTSQDDGRKARPRAWETSHDVVQLAHEIGRSPDWATRLPSDAGRPQVHFKPIAAGEILQNSRDSSDARWIHDIYNDAAAIEMEAAGFAQAGHLSRTRAAIVRGISDRADGTKNPNDDGTWQPRAAANAAAFAIRLAEEIISEGVNADMSHKPQSPSEAAVGNTVFNLASGTVGIQAANVSDSTVWMNTVPAQSTGADELAAAVAGLREHLDRASANGEVDDDTFAAARDELATAEAALGESVDKAGPKASLLALKRLSGLVAGTTHVAANVAQVIAALGRLS